MIDSHGMYNDGSALERLLTIWVFMMQILFSRRSIELTIIFSLLLFLSWYGFIFSSTNRYHSYWLFFFLFFIGILMLSRCEWTTLRACMCQFVDKFVRRGRQLRRWCRRGNFERVIELASRGILSSVFAGLDV